MPKLEVGDANDPFEREADAVADEVMRMPEPAVVANDELSFAPTVAAVTSATAAGPGPAARRKCAGCEAEGEQELRRSFVHRITRKCSTCEAEDELRRACASCAAGEEQLLREPAAGQRGGTVSNEFNNRLHSRMRLGGAPLPGQARDFLEPRLGLNLDYLRVHNDRSAGELAKHINARAFTLGHHLFFAPGQLRPESPAGMRLLTHEVAHTLQPRRGIKSMFPKVRRSAADNLVSSADHTAEAVLDDVVAGSFYMSYEFEERVRKLSKGERKRLRAMMVSQSFPDQEIVDELITVLDNVIAGYLGGTVGHVESRPCEPGDVEPVSMWEWTGDPIITDLELLESSGESQGKLGRHTPSSSLRLFQRALVQWGCESASPARNPLPQYGADGAHGGEFRRGVRQFQRQEGLSADGTAGPLTVKAMALELYGINFRDDVERELDIDRAREQLEAQQAADGELHAREDRIQRLIWRLYEEGGRYRKNQSVQYEANVSMLVAQKIQGFGAEVISEGLERVQLQEPEFYDHVLFGGRLISSLQELGVFGIRYKAPSDADFLDGFIIEANELEHNSPLTSPEFSGWDVGKIFAGFTVGTVEGIAKGFAAAVEGVAALFTTEFWMAMHEMVPKLIEEPSFRFEIGRASAEMLHKQLAELNASKPYGYGNKLGVLFGMLVFEIAVGLLTGGAGTAATKGLDGAKLLAKFPRLQRLGKRVASTSLVRAGVSVGSKLAKGATATLERVQKLLGRVRKLLPDLSSNAKFGRQIDEFAEADRLAALASKKELARKLDELELEHEKLELALAQAEPDLDQVERLAKSVERKAEEIERLADRAGAGKPAVSPASVSKQTLALIEEGRNVERVADLPPPVLDAELRYVAAADGRAISLRLGDRDFDHEVGLPNEHSYRHDEGSGSWCRFSEGRGDNCVDGAQIESKGVGAQNVTADSVTHAKAGSATDPQGTGAHTESNFSVTYGKNELIKLRKHSQHIRETARPFGVDIPRKPKDPKTQDAMRNWIERVVREGRSRQGPYMTFNNVLWSRLGDGIVIRRASGEFLTYLDYRKGGVAYGWNNAL